MSMKELQTQKENIAVVQKVAEQKKQLFLGRLNPHKGQFCYQLNIKTGQLTIAEFNQVNRNLDGSVQKKIIVKEDCIYTTAINPQNAQRKFFKALKQTHA